MINEYSIGEEVILTVKFRNRLGVPTDPVTVEGAVKPPNTAAIEVDFTPTGITGEWEAVFMPTIEGKHWWRAQGTGTVDTAEERAFKVKPERVIIP